MSPNPASTTQVSIIIPAFNAGRYLESTLTSIRDQHFPYWECIVVNDGSTDATGDIANRIAKADSRIRVFHQKNAGVSAARNFALKQISHQSQYIAFMDADDLYVPDGLLRLLELTRDGVIGAHGLAGWIDSDGKSLQPQSYSDANQQRLRTQGWKVTAMAPEERTDFNAVVTKSFYPPGTAILRREIAKAVGDFDPTLSPAEDWDYWVRVLRHGDMAFTDQTVCLYRKHGSNASGAVPKLHRANDRVRLKTFLSSENRPGDRHLLRKCHRAGNVYRLRLRLAAIWKDLKAFRLIPAFRTAGFAAIHAVRFIIGRPTKLI